MSVVRDRSRVAGTRICWASQRKQWSLCVGRKKLVQRLPGYQFVHVSLANVNSLNSHYQIDRISINEFARVVRRDHAKDISEARYSTVGSRHWFTVVVVVNNLKQLFELNTSVLTRNGCKD